jgi:hypothetical protein
LQAEQLGSLDATAAQANYINQNRYQGNHNPQYKDNVGNSLVHPMPFLLQT